MTVLLAGATGCILVDRFHELAPDEDLALVPANDGGDDAPPVDAGGRDVTLEASDAAVIKTGKTRWVTVIDQGIASGNAVVWGDVRVHPAGGFVATTSFTGTTSGKTSAGKRDVAVMKLDDSGKVLWLERFGGAEDDDGHAVALDPNGNIWISGASDGHPFLEKLDANGALVTATPIDSSAVTDGSCHGLAITATSEVYAACRFAGTIAYETSTGGTESRASNGGVSDLLLARVDPVSAKFISTEVYGGNDFDIVWDLAVATSDVIMTGAFDSSSFSPTGRVRVGPGTNAFAFERDGPTGLRSWARSWGQTSSDGLVRGLAIGVGPGGNLAVGGDFRGSFDFGSAGKATVATRSAWVAGLDRTAFGSETSLVVVENATSAVRGLAVDGEGDILAVGDFVSSSASSVGGHLLPHIFSDRSNGFVFRANREGKVLWAKSWVSSTGHVFPTRVRLDPSGRAVVLGTFTGDVDFGDGIVKASAAKGSTFVALVDP